MSYRHSSYRKMGKALRKANAAARRGEPFDLVRSEMDRVLCWTNEPPLPKPANWGVPRRKRSAA